MEIEIQLTATRIEDTPLACVPVGEVGAWVEFRGIVRAQEDGKPISGLEYEAYLPMAQAQMHRILSDLAAHEPCLSVRVIHRIGRVAAGETAIYVGIGARHRADRTLPPGRRRGLSHDRPGGRGRVHLRWGREQDQPDGAGTAAVAGPPAPPAERSACLQ